MRTRRAFLGGISAAAMALALPLSESEASRLRLLLQGGNGGTLASVGPGPAWNGVAASGYAGSPPVIPARTGPTAAARFMVPFFQRFAEDLVVIADAGAFGGIAYGEWFVEGSTATCPEWTPVFDVYEGENRQRGGYAIKLNHAAFMAQKGADGTNKIHLYFRAWPNNPAISPRTIGPLILCPELTDNDNVTQDEFSFAADGSAAYLTLTAAMAAAQAANRKAALFRCKSSGAYNIDRGAGTTYMNNHGWHCVTAAPGVNCTIEKTVADYSAAPNCDPRFDGIRFRGVKIDTVNFAILLSGTGTSIPGQNHWIDKCLVTNSIGTPYAYYWMLGEKPQGFLEGGINPTLPPNVAPFQWGSPSGIPDGRGFVTDSIFEFGNFQLGGHALVSNCYAHNTVERFVNGCMAAVNNYLDRTSITWFRTAYDVFTVTYTGPEAAATVSKTGNNRTAGPLNFYENGVLVLAIPLALNSANPFYRVQSIIDWVNGVGTNGWEYAGQSSAAWAAAHPGWTLTASAIPPAVERRTEYLEFQGYSDAVPQLNVKNVTLTATTFDAKHAGLFNINVGGTGYFTNLVHRRNVARRIDYDETVGQNTSNMLFDVALEIQDVMVMQCTWEGGNQIQVKNSAPWRHVVFEGCTGVRVGLSPGPFTTSSTGGSGCDEFCALVSDALHFIVGSSSVGNVLPNNLNVIDCYQVLSLPTPGNMLTGPNVSGLVTGLLADSRFVNEAAGDFRPAPGSALEVNLRPRIGLYDDQWRAFSATDAIGAWALGGSAPTYPDRGGPPVPNYGPFPA